MSKLFKSFCDRDVFYRKAATHDSEIQRLYEEMEQQIKNEKDRILLEVNQTWILIKNYLEMPDKLNI